MYRPAAGWIGPVSIPRNCCSSSSSYPRWDSSRSDNSAASRRISKRPSVLPVPRRPRYPLLPGESGEVHRADDRGLLPGSANYSLLPRRTGRRRLRPSDAPAPEARRQHPSARPARPHHCARFRCPWLPLRYPMGIRCHDCPSFRRDRGLHSSPEFSPEHDAHRLRQRDRGDQFHARYAEYLHQVSSGG